MTVASAYPNYKDSGVPWMTRIPEHWVVVPFRRLITRRKLKNRPDFPLLSVLREKGVVARSTLGKEENHNYIPDDLSNYRVALQGDLVINKMKSWQGSVGIAPMDGIVSPAYFVFSLKGITSGYAHCLLRSRLYADFFARASDGVRVGQWDLNIDQMKRISVFLPPRPEQDQIVAYLRAQDAHIARFIKAKRDLIKLLTEQKLRIIDHAVTRGLDSSVTLKPSGIEWLGEVPEHWEVSKVKLLADYINGFPFKPAEWGTKGRPIIRIQNLTNEHAAFNYYDGAVPERNHVKDGDILLSWSASLGVFVWHRGDAWLNQHIFKVVPDPKRITRGYFVWLAQWFLNHMAAEAHGSTMQHVTKPKFGSFPVPLPSLSEQMEIETHINRETQDIDLAIARTEEEIKLIREYRDRLIADVVTGQVDVRSWQPSADDIVDDALLDALGDENEDIAESENSDGED